MWNVFDLLQYQFMQNAFIAGSIVAVIAAAIGYFVILRGLTFAGHSLGYVGFAGAAGAVLLGIDPVFGLLVFTTGAAIGIGILGKEVRERDIAIGIITMLGLGLGVLFLALYTGYAEQAYSILFGTIVGISRTDVLVTVLASMVVGGILLFIFRPLLFSSLDEEMAEARGVPVRMLSILFLVLVALVVSISVQIIGVLLIFTLLIGPAATASRLIRRPAHAILLAMVLGLLYTWLGIVIAAYSNWPVSFCIATLSFGVYLPVRLLSPLLSGRRQRQVAGTGNGVKMEAHAPLAEAEKV
jgi:zinc/manganese transport system permease protein